MSAPKVQSRKAAVMSYTLQEEDDTVVLSFGPDYFRGARAGSFYGGLCTGLWCYSIYRRMKLDQRDADKLLGLKPGQHNPSLSRWVLARGLRTQPMLTVGFITLLTTTLLKSVKCSLAHQRCVEFMLDDVEFAMLEQLSEKDPETRRMLLAMSTAATGDRASVSRSPPTPAGTAESAAALQSVLSAKGTYATARNPRRPTFMDGVAVGLLGSVMDCYVPQKPLQRYLGMSVGYR